MKHFFQYPKLFLLACSFVVAYALFDQGFFEILAMHLNGNGYVSSFLGGLLFSFGFTSPFAIGIFIEMAPHVNPLLAAPIAGLGAFLADLLIFELIRFSFFHDELHLLKSTRWFQRLESLLYHESIPEKIRDYLLWSFAGIVIASPLPDEIGVTLVASLTQIEGKKFGILCFTLNTLGIFFIFSVARAASGI